MDDRPLVTGVGVVSAVGQGRTAFASALFEGSARFHELRRAGRQRGTTFIGAEIAEIKCPSDLSARLPRAISLSALAAVVALDEAWHDAALENMDPRRIGLIVGGSNYQQRELTLLHEAYSERVPFLKPIYGLSFMDSDLCGLCTQLFGIRGLAFTLGAASASGQAAVVEAAEAVQSGRLDACIALGALMDLSYWELQALRSLGAMGSERFAAQPQLACRPFDRQRDGFVFGECCAALVIERPSVSTRSCNAYARVSGWSTTLDGNRNPNPSLAGEVLALRSALEHARLTAADIDYVNPHGSASLIGDETELQALSQSFLRHAYINTTKSIVGHGLSAAGTVELAATLVQMRAGRLHPCVNLDDPIDRDMNWVLGRAREHRIENALSISLGFGGVNTAICLSRSATERAVAPERVG